MEEKNRKMVCVNLSEEEYRSLKKMLVDMGMTIQDYLHSKIEEDLSKVKDTKTSVLKWMNDL